MVRRRSSTKQTTAKRASAPTSRPGRPSALLDTRIVYSGGCFDQLPKLRDDCVDLIYIDAPFNSNRNYEVFWGETKEKRAFENGHASTQAYIDYMRPRCFELQHVPRTTGTFRLRKLPPTHYHAFRMRICIASVGSGAAFCKGNV